MSSKVLVEITYPLQNFNGWSLGMDKLFQPIIYNGYNYIYVMWLKLIHVCERDTCQSQYTATAQVSGDDFGPFAVEKC